MLPELDSFDALVDIQRSFVSLLIGDHAIEEARFRRARRRRGIWRHGLRRGLSGESESEHHD